jgi:hypothetical protein
MEELIIQAFLHVKDIGPYVQEGHYDLVGPNGEIILPQIWETMIEPDWAITMHMWPMPEQPKGQLDSVTIANIVPPRSLDRNRQASQTGGRQGPPPPPPPLGYIKDNISIIGDDTTIKSAKKKAKKRRAS